MAKTGDIVLLSLDPTRGGEKGKTRPCLVVVGSGHPWGLVIVVPITDQTGKRSHKLFVPLPAAKQTGLSKPSMVDCFQIRCVSEERVLKKLGSAPEAVLREVRVRLAMVLDIGEEHVT